MLSFLHIVVRVNPSTLSSHHAHPGLDPCGSWRFQAPVCVFGDILLHYRRKKIVSGELGSRLSVVTNASVSHVKKKKKVIIVPRVNSK